jgi:hypothetical protein
MKYRIIVAAALLASPAAAQQSAPAAETAAPAAIDPARLALARTTVDYFWPIGTYERMMNGTMDQMMDNMVESMSDMKMGDMTAPYGSDAMDSETAGKTVREVMAKLDPHFKERLSIMHRVMISSMIPMMNRLEPDIREGMARVYARRFSPEQLRELNRFFATPTGRVYASESMMLFADPEIVSLMGKFGPELAKEMPQIMQRVKEATAHLPPPPPPPRHGRGKRRSR